MNVLGEGGGERGVGLEERWGWCWRRRGLDGERGGKEEERSESESVSAGTSLITLFHTPSYMNAMVITKKCPNNNLVRYIDIDKDNRSKPTSHEANSS